VYPAAPAVTRPVRPVVYLAGPIDRVDEAASLVASRYRADRSTLRNLLAESGFAVYAPHLAWSGVSLATDTCTAVDEVNDRALLTADALIALLPPGVPTRGTFAEIEQAAQDGIPTVAVTPSSRPSRLVAGVIWVSDIEEALTTVEAWRERGLLGTRGKPVAAHPVTPEVAPSVEPNGALAPLPFTVKEGIGTWAVPTRHYSDDAALDLWVSENRTVNPGRFTDVPSGVNVQLPVGTWGMIVGRSSAVRKRGILVVTGIIDVGYRGDLFVGCYNVGEHPQTLAKGERIGQLIVMPNLTQHYQPVVVESLEPSERGTDGFGSTGGIGRSEA
jgi:dUTP pyrophosphatase